MRVRVASLLIASMCASIFARGATFSESGAPEAVYYANAYADHYHLPRELVHAIIEQESGWNQNALSNKGAIGLMQLMPATAAHFYVHNPTSIQENIAGGVRYLAALSSHFHRDLRMVVAAYYCGEHHIVASGLRYHNAEVIAYVSAVEKRYEHEIQLHHSRKTKDETK